MLIDWFTVVAQIVNFLALVALLKHFFWARLVKAIDEREKRIAGRLAEAEAKKHQAELAVERAQAQSLEDERARAALLAQAQREADELGMRTIREARESVRALQKKWLDELDRDKAAFLSDVRRRSAAQMIAVIRRALADLACADLQNSTVHVFMEKLHSLDAATLREIIAGGKLIVATAGDLPEEEQNEIRLALAPAALEFVRDPALAWGIELRTGGRKIGWNLDGYLDSLEQSLGEELERPAASLLQMVS